MGLIHKLLFAVNGKFSFTRLYSTIVAAAGTVYTLAQANVIHLSDAEMKGLLIVLFIGGKLTIDALRGAVSKPVALPCVPPVEIAPPPTTPYPIPTVILPTDQVGVNMTPVMTPAQPIIPDAK